MAYGIQIINASGYTQIDENYSNFSLYATGSTNSWGGFPSYGDEITLIRLPYGGFFGYDDGWMTSNATVEYRTYRPSTAVGGAGTHGIRVYNSSGGVTFDSNQTTMRIYSLQMYSNQYMHDNWGGVTLGSPSGARPWLALDCLGFLGYENADGGIGNISFAIGIVVRQNGDNSLTFFGAEGIGYGPPIEGSIWFGEGSRSYLFGE